jgi:hypothetical protein
VVKESRADVAVAWVSVAAAMALSCGAVGDVGLGGSCHTATDCAPGLYCYPLTAPQGGTCTSNAAKAQPPSDGGYPDAGLAPMLDAIASGDSSVDAATDATTTSDTASSDDVNPVDSGLAGESGGDVDASTGLDAASKDANSSGG